MLGRGDVVVVLSGQVASGSGAVVERLREAHGGGSQLRTSVSHAGGVLAVALARGCRVGIDVEPLRERGLRALPRHALAPSELATLSCLAPAERLAAFLGYWTRKEALLKAAGVGLAVDPRGIELALDAEQPVAVPGRLGRPGDWWVVPLAIAGFAAAVALDVEPRRVRVSGDCADRQQDDAAADEHRGRREARVGRLRL